MENGRIIPYLKKNPALSRKELVSTKFTLLAYLLLMPGKLEQVADGLDFIHKCGVVHADQG